VDPKCPIAPSEMEFFTKCLQGFKETHIFKKQLNHGKMLLAQIVNPICIIGPNVKS
jgi:hypothetical protein